MFCIANKQIDTVFHGEAGRMIAHDNTCDSHEWKNLCLCSLTIKILKLMNTLLLNATSSKRKESLLKVIHTASFFALKS